MSKTKKTVLTGLFSAITAIFSQIAVPLPLTPVPVTLSLAAVFFSGFTLTPGCAFFSMITYLLLGLAGVPVFAGFKGGLPSLMGPTGGFLLAYPAMAWLISFASGKLKVHGKIKTALLYVMLMIAALTVCYAAGALWFSVIALGGFGDVKKAFTLCVLPFLPADAAKIALTAFVTINMKNRI